MVIFIINFSLPVMLGCTTYGDLSIYIYKYPQIAIRGTPQHHR